MKNLFTNINFFDVVGTGNYFEYLAIDTLEPVFEKEVVVFKYENTVGTEKDRLGCDLELGVFAPKDRFENIDITKSRGWKAWSVYKKRDHVRAGTVLTTCIVDAQLLEELRQGVITVLQFLDRGVELWEELRDLAVAGDRDDVVRYCNEWGYDPFAGY